MSSVATCSYEELLSILAADIFDYKQIYLNHPANGTNRSAQSSEFVCFSKSVESDVSGRVQKYVPILRNVKLSVGMIRDGMKGDGL